MTLFKRDIPFRAVLAVVALVLIASIVSGREPPQTPPPVAWPAQRAEQTDTLANVDVNRLKLAMRLETGADVLGLQGASLPASSFIGREESAATPPEPAPAAFARPRAQTARAIAPLVPPLPFSYLGRLIEGETTKVFIARGTDHYSAEAGLIIDDIYKVEGVSGTAVTFVFLPSGTRQVLALPVLND